MIVRHVSPIWLSILSNDFKKCLLIFLSGCFYEMQKTAALWKVLMLKNMIKTQKKALNFEIFDNIGFFSIFTKSVHWADLVQQLQSLSVCVFVPLRMKMLFMSYQILLLKILSLLDHIARGNLFDLGDQKIPNLKEMVEKCFRQKNPACRKH